ncbi:MAG TPA: hypothetical protein VD905_09130, partial [Flavobacteriales bacterium]|nr:hypothetical protein [Flavobacteriales bacterium]
LSILLDDGKDKISKDKLVQKGFNFTYFTHSFTSKTGKYYQFWYDHGLMQMDNGGFFIVRDKKEEAK